MTTSPHVLTASAVLALLLDTDPFLGCDECFDRLDAHVEAILTDGMAVDQAMVIHLAGCPACADEAEGLLALAGQPPMVDVSMTTR